MPDRSRANKRGAAREYQHTNRREPNSPRLIRRLKPASTLLIQERCKHSPWTHFAQLTNPQPYQRDGAEPPLVRASAANMRNCFIKSNLDFTAASGWLQRLVRRGAWLHRKPSCAKISEGLQTNVCSSLTKTVRAVMPAGCDNARTAR